MNRPLIVAILGVLVVAAALVLNFTLQRPGGLSGGANAPVTIGPGSPSFDVVRIDPKGNMVMAGRAQPGAVVVILDGDKEIGRVTADNRGEWVFLPNTPVAPGTRQFSLKTPVPGGKDLFSQNVVVMSVPEHNGEVLVVEQSRDGGKSRVLQGPNAPGTGSLTVDAVDYSADGKFALNGKADPGSTVQIYLDNQFIGRAVADAKGAWEVEPTSKASAGKHSIRADQIGANNNVIGRLEIPLVLDPAQATMAPGAITVIKGNSLWRLARHTYGQGVMFTLIYEANKDLIKDANLIYPGQVFNLPSKNRP